MFLGMLGAGALFLPWAEATVVLIDPAQKPRADGSYQARRIYDESYPGYRFWHADATAGAFLGLVLFLAVTGGIEPAPWWRSAVLLTVGGAIIGTVIAGMNFRYAVAEGNWAAGRVVELSWTAVNYAAIGLAVAVMLVAAFEFRARINGSRRKQACGVEGLSVAAPAPGRHTCSSDSIFRPGGHGR